MTLGNPRRPLRPWEVPEEGEVPDEGRGTRDDATQRSATIHPPESGLYVRNVIYFAALHLLPFGAVFTGAPARAFAVGLALYLVRIWFITAGYHCYFSHRSFKTGRLFQFILGFGAQTSGQGSVLRWAAAHRYHHANADRMSDLHSPPAHGFWYAHVGWLLNTRYIAASTPSAAMLQSQTRELAWLDRYSYVPMVALAAVTLAVWGLPGLFIAFGASTVLTFHATFCVNSLAHRFGSRRFGMLDQSRNNWFVALIMLGGGWHNNHHRYPRSARQGLRWWEFDVTYYGLVILSWLGIVKDVIVAVDQGEKASGLLRPTAPQTLE